MVVALFGGTEGTISDDGGEKAFCRLETFFGVNPSPLVSTTRPAVRLPTSAASAVVTTGDGIDSCAVAVVDETISSSGTES